jgi:predicted metal-dependent RNase
MRLTFYGGCREVGRNCALVESGNDHLMLDCGVKIGKVEEYPLIEPERIKRIRHIAITHTHLDHIGFLPHFFSQGGKAKVYSTKPTRDMMALLLADYHRLLEYGKETRLGDMKFSLHNAGHILGSSMVRVQGKKTMLFTGDVNNRGTRLLDPAQANLHAHTMVMESTYGAKDDVIPAIKKASAELAESAKRTLEKGGFVLIPAFAVGRSQEILITLESYMRSGAIPRAPIYVDGMILKANKVYRQNIIYARREIQERILKSDEDPFKSPLFKAPHTKHKSEVFEEPAIIVSTSGMLTGGPILRYLKEVAGDHNSLLMLVGYQAEGTTGRRLLDGEKKIEIEGEEVDVRLKVENVSFSAHSDHQGLLQFASSVKGLKRIFLIHGEEKKSGELASDLKKYEVIIPRNGESYSL